MTIGKKDYVVGDATGNSYTMEADTTWSSSQAKNGHTGDTVGLAGLGRSLDHYTRGHNTFRFDGPGSGQDEIGAFGYANGFRHGLDHIQLGAKYGYADGAAALAHTADTGAGGYAQVDLGHGDGIALFGVHKADLTASDFTIA